MSARTARGFTLLELIVVIGIFGVFAAMAYGGLDRVMTARKHIEQSLDRTEEYQKAYQRLRADFESASARAVRDGDGYALNLFTYDGYYKRIEFTRGGWANLLNLPRASLQRVGYFLDDSKIENKKLIRRAWPVLDRAPQTQPVDTPLLEHIDGLSWRFMDANHAWSETWPSTATPIATSAGATTTGGTVNPPTAPTTQAGRNAMPPLAVEMTLKTRDWGDLRLLFRFGPDSLTAATSLPTGASGVPPPSSDGTSTGGDDSGSTGGGSGGTGGGSPDGGGTSGSAAPANGDAGAGPKVSP